MDSKLAVQIGKQIRVLRVFRSWSQEDLATKSGLTQTQVSALERGKSQHINNLELVAEAFQMTVSDLIKSAEDSTEGAA